MLTFEVTQSDYNALSKSEQNSVANNGCGKELANYIRVERNGQTIYLENDAIEPEDARFSRDLSWVKEALDYAYQCGVHDGKLAVGNLGGSQC